MGAVPLVVKLLTEFIGTFFLMLTVLVSGGNALLIGAALALIVFLTGGISGAAVNPALTLGLFTTGTFDMVTTLTYIAVQVAAGIGAAWTYRAVA